MLQRPVGGPPSLLGAGSIKGGGWTGTKLGPEWLLGGCVTLDE